MERDEIASGPARLLTVSQFVEKHSWATKGGLRALLFNRKKNGLDAAVVRLGRKLLLDEEQFFQWLESRGREAGNGRG